VYVGRLVVVVVQLISGVIEQRVLDKVFASQPVASRTGSFVVRSLNTYLGSALMIEWLKILVRGPVVDHLWGSTCFHLPAELMTPYAVRLCFTASAGLGDPDPVRSRAVKHGGRIGLVVDRSSSRGSLRCIPSL
jgi:hypothetical protein